MGRSSGARNADFEKVRSDLLRAARARLLTPGGAGVSLRELAAAVGVSVATLRHYFGDKEGLITAVFEQLNQDGAFYLLQVTAAPVGPVEESLRWLLSQVKLGLQEGGLTAVHALGLSAGLQDARLGPAYLNQLLEPTLQAVEARLARHVTQQELLPCDLRHAALMLIGPVLLASLHQTALGGSNCRPLNQEGFLEAHLQAFLRAYRTSVLTTPDELRD